MIINFYRSINENIDPTCPRSRHANMKNNKLCKRDNIFNFGKGNSIETDMYIIWTIMYDYKLANIPRIIGVMRSRLTDAYGKPQNLDSPDRHYLEDSRYVRSLHLLDERNVPRLKALSFHRFPIQFRKGESLPFSRNPRIEI